MHAWAMRAMQHARVCCTCCIARCIALAPLRPCKQRMPTMHGRCPRSVRHFMIMASAVCARAVSSAAPPPHAPSPPPPPLRPLPHTFHHTPSGPTPPYPVPHPLAAQAATPHHPTHTCPPARQCVALHDHSSSPLSLLLRGGARGARPGPAPAPRAANIDLLGGLQLDMPEIDGDIRSLQVRARRGTASQAQAEIDVGQGFAGTTPAGCARKAGVGSARHCYRLQTLGWG